VPDGPPPQPLRVRTGFVTGNIDAFRCLSNRAVAVSDDDVVAAAAFFVADNRNGFVMVISLTIGNVQLMLVLRALADP
jgi:hypothetical protein